MDVNYTAMKDRTEDKYERAKKKVKAIKGFHGHLWVYILVNVLLLLLRADILSVVTGREVKIYAEEWIHWNILSSWFLWGIAVLIHGLYVYRHKFGFIKTWEERKIKELMDKEENKNNERWS